MGEDKNWQKLVVLACCAEENKIDFAFVLKEII